MKNRARSLLIPVLLVLSTAGLDGPQPAEFKVFARFYGAADEPISRFEIVCSKGRIYQFPDEADEYLIYDPADRSCSLVDRRRRVFARVPPDRLDSAMATLRRKLRESIDRKASSKDRGDRVEARIHLDLIEPRFVAEFEPAENRLKLSNGSVRVDARGAPEADPSRIALIRDSTASFIKLGALRDSDSIPPFTRLDALDALYSRKLVPVETSFVYRLTGPPIKYRWEYTPEARLDGKDHEALSKVDRSRASMKLVAFADYEKG